MKKKLFTLLTLLVMCVTGAWATGEVYYVKFQSSSTVTQSQANYFSYDKGEGNDVTWSSKGKHSCTYGNETYSNVIKMESTTRCFFTTEAVATITIVQTISDATGDKLKFDNTNLNSSMANTTVSVNSDNKYNEYVITGVKAGTHTITRQSETGLAYVKVEYTGEASLVVADPSISWNSSTNQATITCSTDGATIYYTTDGSEPTTSSTVFSSAIPLTNSTSIRAIAKKSDVVSNLVKSDCYVNHSTADKYLATIGYKDGTREDDTKYKWTSSDGNYIITMANTTREMGYVNLAGSQDGFKLNAVDVYTLQPSSEIKITKLVVVGKTWLEGSSGNASTISVDGFTPTSGTFFEYPTGGETYVKTLEFTPTTEQTYGQAITMRPGNNQLGAYIEIYGVKRSGPADPTVGCVEITCSGGTISNGTWTGTKDTDAEGYSLGTGISQKSNTSYFQLPASTTFTINVPSGVTVSSFSISGYSNSAGDASVTYNESGKSFPKNDNVPTTQSWMIENPSAGKSISFTTGGKDLIVSTITLNTGKIYLTTTANMAGWRSFYDADQGYTLDGNTTAYIATSSDNTTTVWLKPIERGVPAATPVILHTTSSADDSYKMTLTKATVAPYSDAIDGTNLLTWETTAVSNKYRLGYGEDGLGFYPYSGTPSNGAVILNVSSMNARTLNFLFENETTGISNLNVNVNDNANIDANAPMYNLAGQKVGKNYKGIVIVNGKKVVRK